MNWLAHVFLSPARVETQLGNLLADLVRGPQRDGMDAEFLAGTRLHRNIDAFTDAHPLVHRSRTRLSAAHRRFSGVLTDVFYDYFLARNWHSFCASPLEQFTTAFYADARTANVRLPMQAQATLERIAGANLLAKYAEPEGVERSLRRLSARLTERWSRPFRLEDSMDELREQEAGFVLDFDEFFPELQAHVARDIGWPEHWRAHV